MASTAEIPAGASVPRAGSVVLLAVATVLASGAALWAVYGRLLGGCWGFVDDYVLTEGSGIFPDWPLWAWVARDGRPLYGFLLNLALTPVDDICDLALVRHLNLGLEAVIAGLAAALAMRGGWPRTASAALGLMLVALPGFALAAAWATLVGPLVAVAAALAAALLATTGDGSRPALGRLAGAACLLAAALAIYQPAAMAFVPGVAIALVRRPATAAALRAGLLPALFVLAAVVVAYGLFFFLLPLLLPGAPASGRAAPVTDLAAKFAWFVGVPLRQAQNLFNLDPVPRFGFAVAAVIALGALLRQRRFRRTAAALAIQAVAIVAAFLPNLVVAESWPSFRASLPMAMTIAALVAAAAVTVAERLAGRWGPALAGLAVAALAGHGLVVMREATANGIVNLQREEWAALVAAVRPIAPGGDRTVALLPPPPVIDACREWQRFDEFGLPSSVRPWAAAAMMRHAWVAAHGDRPPPRFVVVAPRTAAPAGATTIDMAALLAAAAPRICGD
ncbi:MAG: glucosyltransferase domain-containing protein [Alphaproteobacteria bacterium]